MERLVALPWTVMSSSNSSSLIMIILLLFAFSSSFASADSSSSTASNDSSSSTLRVLVPWKVGFDQFVSTYTSDNGTLIDGFSVQVFLQALRRVKSPPPYRFILVGHGKETPPYDDMVQKVVNGEADAIVADLTVTRERMERVDFTMPYVESALVMVTTFRYGSAGTLWDFLKPFSWQLWVVLFSSFAATGAVLYLLENNHPDFYATKHPGPAASTHVRPPAEADPSLQPPTDRSDPGPATQYAPPEDDTSGLQTKKASLKRRFMNAYWFTSLCIFAAQQELVRTHLGRIVTVTWLFVMLIFNSSYTASLASLLSAQQSYPAIESFDALLTSNVAVGYQEGSFMRDFLTSIGFPLKRLRSYASEQDYAQALTKGPKNGGVGAVLDELPYTQILLQAECNSFTAVGNERAYFGGFGFGFRKNFTLTDEISKAILSLAEDGVLQNLKNGWIGGDDTGQCSSADEPSHLRLRSFGGLFSILGSVYFICITWRLLPKALRKGRCYPAEGGSATAKKGEIVLGSFSRRRSNKVTDDDDGSHSEAMVIMVKTPPNQRNLALREQSLTS